MSFLSTLIDSIKQGMYIKYVNNIETILAILALPLSNSKNYVNFDGFKISNIDIANKAIQIDGIYLKYVTFNILNYNLMLQAVKNNGLVIEYIIGLYGDFDKLGNINYMTIEEIFEKLKHVKTIFSEKEKTIFIDKPLIIEAVKQNSLALKYVIHMLDFEQDYEIFIEAIKNNPESLQYIKYDSILDTFSQKYLYLVEQALMRDGLTLRFVPRQYKYMDQVINKALEQNVNAYQHINTNIYKEKIDLCKLVSCNGLLLKYIFAKDITYEILYNAIANNENALVYALQHAHIPNFRNIIEMALNKNGLLLENVANVLPIDVDLAHIAINQNPNAIKYCLGYLHKIKGWDYVLEKNGLLLQYIENPTLNQVIIAVTNNGCAIKYAREHKYNEQVYKISLNNGGIAVIRNDISLVNNPQIRPLLKKIDNTIYCNKWMYSDAKAAILQNPQNINITPDLFLEYYDDDNFLRLSAINADGTLLERFIALKECIFNPVNQKKLCLEAVKKNGLALQYTMFKKVYECGYDNIEETQFRIKKLNELRFLNDSFESKKKIVEAEDPIDQQKLSQLNIEYDDQILKYFASFYDNFVLDPSKHVTQYDGYVKKIPNLVIKRYSYNVALEYEANYQDQDMCDIAVINNVNAIRYVSNKYITLEMCLRVLKYNPNIIFLLGKTKKAVILDIILKNIIIIKERLSLSLSTFDNKECLNILDYFLNNKKDIYYCVDLMTTCNIFSIDSNIINVTNFIKIYCEKYCKTIQNTYNPFIINTNDIGIETNKRLLFEKYNKFGNAILICNKKTKTTIYVKKACNFKIEKILKIFY